MKKKMMWVILFVYLLGCGVINSSSMTPTTTQAAIPSLSRTGTVVPTGTPRPTVSPWPTDNPFIVLPAPTSLPTRAPISEMLYIGYLSPNGKWVASTVGSDISIYHVGGALVWKVPKLYPFAGYATFAWRQWSSDSRYLYFSTTPTYCGGSSFEHLHNGDGVWRLDIVSGDITEILAPSYTGEEHRLRSVVISPDERLLAYVNTNFDPFELVIVDVDSGQERKRFEVGKGLFSVGDIVWSPDGTKIIYTAIVVDEMESDWDYPKRVSYHLYLIDWRNGSQNFLINIGWADLDMSENVMDFRGWVDDRTISFHVENTCGKVSLFDVNTKEFTGEVFPGATPRPVFWPTPPYAPSGTECPPLPTPTLRP